MNIETEKVGIDEMKTVRIPLHLGHASVEVSVDLVWKCPICGRRRGEPFSTHAFDGSMRLYVDGWENPCGHIEKYEDVWQEARARGIKVTARNV